MARPDHPNKEIEAAVRYAEAVGWRCVLSRGHAWGKLYCPNKARFGCIISVWSTPRNPGNFANQLWRRIKKCPH